MFFSEGVTPFVGVRCLSIYFDFESLSCPRPPPARTPATSTRSSSAAAPAARAPSTAPQATSSRSPARASSSSGRTIMYMRRVGRASSSTPSAVGTSSCTTTSPTTPSVARRTSVSTISTSRAGGRWLWTERLLPGSLHTSPKKCTLARNPWALGGLPRKSFTTSNLSPLGYISGTISTFA